MSLVQIILAAEATKYQAAYETTRDNLKWRFYEFAKEELKKIFIRCHEQTNYRLELKKCKALNTVYGEQVSKKSLRWLEELKQANKLVITEDLDFNPYVGVLQIPGERNDVVSRLFAHMHVEVVKEPAYQEYRAARARIKTMLRFLAEKAPGLEMNLSKVNPRLTERTLAKISQWKNKKTQ